MRFLFLLFLTIQASGTYDRIACENVQQEITANCVNKGECNEIQITGGQSSRKQNSQDCVETCTKLSVMSTANDVVCDRSALPSNQPAPQNHESNQQEGQKAAQQSAAQEAAHSENALKSKEAKATDANQFSKEVQAKNIKSSNELLKEWDRELSSGKSKNFPPERSKWKNDQALVNEASRARAKKEEFPEKKADQAKLPAIRSNLHLFSRAKELERDSSKDLAAIALAIAQLAQMKSAGQANVDGLAAQSKRPLYSSSSGAEAEKKVLGEVSSALKGKSGSGSPIAAGEKNGAAESGAESASNNSQAAAEAADGSEAQRAALRTRLRELLRKKMGIVGGQDIPDEFLGELGLTPGSDSGLGEGGSQEQLALSKEEEEIFRLAGAETDAEVNRLRAELQEELAQSGGILPSESLSLFERVKAAHNACASKRCVAAPQQAAALQRKKSNPA